MVLSIDAYRFVNANISKEAQVCLISDSCLYSIFHEFSERGHNLG